MAVGPAGALLLNQRIMEIYQTMIKEAVERRAREHGHEVGDDDSCPVCLVEAALES